MPNPDDAVLSPAQRKWFASLREGLQRDTGRSLAEWVEIARSCPETQPRRRLKWFKETHGLLQNRASYVLGEAFGSEGPGWSRPEELTAVLWADPGAREILRAAEVLLLSWPGVVMGPRKTFTGFSRSRQFAALKPHRGGALLGMAVAPEGTLEAATGREGWSERLKSKAMVIDPASLPDFAQDLRAAYEGS